MMRPSFEARKSAHLRMTEVCAAELSLVPQRPPKQLSRRSGRQLAHPVKCLRHLETGEMTFGAQVLIERRCSRRRAASHQKRLDALSRLRIRLADHGALRDVRMRQQRVLDLLARDLDAAGIDDIVDAAEDPEVVVVIEPSEIAAAPPAIAKFFARQRFVFRVADSNRRPGWPELQVSGSCRAGARTATSRNTKPRDFTDSRPQSGGPCCMRRYPTLQSSHSHA